MNSRFDIDPERLALYYERHGAPSDLTPAVLLHGGGSTIESNWKQMIPRMSQTREVIAVEFQGHGHSPPIDRAPSFVNSAADLSALLDDLDLTSVDLIGFSNGGNIALRLSQIRPELVRRQIVASAPPTRDGMVDGFWDGMKDASIDSLPQIYRDADERASGDSEHYRILFDNDRAQMLGFVDMSDDELREIRVRTLFVAGDRDIVKVAHLARAAELVPESRLLIVPGGHGDYFGEVLATSDGGRAFELTLPWIIDFLDR